MERIDLKEDLLNGAKAAAAYLGVSARAVYHMSENNLIPVIRKGQKLFFRKSELDAAFRADAA
ncbi:MAG: helix-turn-helix domain-containing protein [Sphingopyxis sp. RIFCSPHIGHO2_01_FULL_65_24]|nr:MAG: helix-turn-helix domain-containing protein [Sphingopyxis sp. RIFCSPHIGHO2_01_FULL_65_24]